jgi:hypothetical protein
MKSVVIEGLDCTAAFSLFSLWEGLFLLFLLLFIPQAATYLHADNPNFSSTCTLNNAFLTW